MSERAQVIKITIYSVDKDEADRLFARLVELIEQKDEDAEAAGSVTKSGSCVYAIYLHVIGFWGFPPVEEAIADFKAEAESIREDVKVDWAIEDGDPA